MKTTKLCPTSPGLKEIDGQIFVLADETVNVEFGEFHSVKTGVAVQIEEGSIGLLAETQPMGQRGVTVSGSFVTAFDLGELRVGILNNSRNAFTVQAGTPVARLVILEASSGSLEEVDSDEWEKIVQESKEKRNEENATLHESAVFNGPAPAPIATPPTTGTGTGDRPNAASVNADAKARGNGNPPPSEVDKANKAKAEADKKAKEQKDIEGAKPPAGSFITGDVTTK